MTESPFENQVPQTMGLREPKAGERTRFPLLFKTLEVFSVFFIMVLINVNSLIRFRQFPEVDNYSDHEGAYIVVAFLTVGAMVYILWKKQLLGVYLTAWKRQVAVILFLVHALLSILWTVYFPATTYKVIFLYFSTIAGAYLAVRYGSRGVIEILTWVAIICTLLSILVVVFFPMVGLMWNELFSGSWNGIFWHRNHTGNIFAFFNMIFLLRFLMNENLSPRQRLIFVFLYILSAAMVIGSRSVTGLMVFLFLHLVVALTVVWLRFHDRIKPWHYYSSATLLAASFLIFITNTAFFFGLLGRSPNMTGRVPIWQDLFQNFHFQKPLLGYGYGALWMRKSFRIMMQIRHNWGNQVYFADNGFFDILLNLGAVGLVLFLAVYIPLGVRSFKQAIQSKHWLAFFPLLTFLYILIGNLTYSFLLEVDQMVWLLLVTMVFLTTSPNNARIPQP